MQAKIPGKMGLCANMWMCLNLAALWLFMSLYVAICTTLILSYADMKNIQPFPPPSIETIDSPLSVFGAADWTSYYVCNQ